MQEIYVSLKRTADLHYWDASNQGPNADNNQKGGGGHKGRGLEPWWRLNMNMATLASSR